MITGVYLSVFAIVLGQPLECVLHNKHETPVQITDSNSVKSSLPHWALLGQVSQ